MPRVRLQILKAKGSLTIINKTTDKEDADGKYPGLGGAEFTIYTSGKFRTRERMVNIKPGKADDRYLQARKFNTRHFGKYQYSRFRSKSK